MRLLRAALCSLALLTSVQTALASSMLEGLGFWNPKVAITIGEEVGGYYPPGIPDGMGAMTIPNNRVLVLLNHELSDDDGYAYTLANGTSLTGARVTALQFDQTSRLLLSAGLAYDTVVDRYGQVVTDNGQITEIPGDTSDDGIHRLCSAWLARAGEYGLVDDIYFTGEETGTGGQEFALDVAGETMYCVPALGRAAFENVTAIDLPWADKVGIVIGDDRAPATLLLYIGTKGAVGDGSFLDRNGLAQGELYVWVSDDGYDDPRDFNGTGTVADGTFVEIDYFQPSMAGQAGFDQVGYANQGTQDNLGAAVGAFEFTRPEDVATNPEDASQVVLTSTGRSSLFNGVDRWGDTYIIDFSFVASTVHASLTILYDGDDAGGGQFQGPDYGLRSPDNLTWAENGLIYVQEDEGTSAFGQTSGEEASVFELDPVAGDAVRIAQIDRSAVPAGQTDNDPNDIGEWESSGIIDVTPYFQTASHERLLLANVQAHSLSGGTIDTENLHQGGQLLFLSNRHDEAVVGLSREVTEVAGLTIVPNPFNPQTTIHFELLRPSTIDVQIVDVRGRLIRTLQTGGLAPGPQALVWDGNNDQGWSVASGVYLVRIRTGRSQLARELVLLK